jgi:N-acetylglucosamine-6-phosphate deacetylase
MTFTLRGARLIDAVSDLPAGDITVDGSTIAEVGEARDMAIPASADGHGTIVDASGMIVVPGYIDVHTHGGGGHSLHTTDPEEICAYARWAPSTGVTSFLVGVVGTPNAMPLAQLRAAARAIEQHAEGAQPLGIHLEGPYISEERRGAHAVSWLRTPSEAETDAMLEAAVGQLRIVTVAPELPGATAMIRRLVEAGVTVSIGHTDASYEQARDAIGLGATHATHCCNAMRPLHHRDPGPLGAVAEARTVRGEVIADGVHVHPAIVRLLVRLLSPERTVVITDALAGAGMRNATFEFGGQRARVIGGAARLADGTITGSVLTMDQALRNVLEMAGVSLQEGIAMLTYNPAQSVGAGTHKARLAPGYDADLVLLDSALHPQATICRGQVAYATRAWKARLRAMGALVSS